MEVAGDLPTTGVKPHLPQSCIELQHSRYKKSPSRGGMEAGKNIVVVLVCCRLTTTAKKKSYGSYAKKCDTGWFRDCKKPCLSF